MSKKLISIDVGIKNLAFCLFIINEENKEYIIKKWDVIDVSESEENKCTENACGKPAKFKKDFHFYCLTHSKKQKSHKVLPKTLKASSLKKYKVKELYSILENHQIKVDPKEKKTKLLDMIDEVIRANYLEEIVSKNASTLDFINISKNIYKKCNSLFLEEDKIDCVIIENQIGKIATRMKTIQGMIVQYFIMSGLDVEIIEFISATNKLKDLDIDKNDLKNYSNRKKIGIQKCIELISNNNVNATKIDYFNQHKKKDDLADSFLQGVWYINNKM